MSDTNYPAETRPREYSVSGAGRYGRTEHLSDAEAIAVARLRAERTGEVIYVKSRFGEQRAVYPSGDLGPWVERRGMF